MYTALLVLLLLSAPPKATPKFEKPPKIEAPKLDLALPDLPKADGLEAPVQPKDQETRQAPGSLRAGTGQPGEKQTEIKLEALEHAFDFTRSAKGYKAVRRIDALAVPGLPANLPAFKTMLRLASPDRIPATVRVRIQTPDGQDLLSSRIDVDFVDNEVMELVVEWEGFQAARLGDYRIVVDIDGKQTEHKLPVRAR